MDLDFPTERDHAPAAENARTSFARDPRRYQMLPFKDGESADNRLLLGAFRYDQFRLFERWPLANYYLKLKVVYVQVEEDGRMVRRPVISEREMNYYARTTLSTPQRAIPPLFPSDKDPFYDYAQDLWNQYTEAKKAAGLEKLSKEEFKAAMDRNPDIKRLRDAASNWSATDRIFFAVFDYAKLIGTKPMAEEDEGKLGWQSWLGPQGVLDRLYMKQKVGAKFWDFSNNGGRVVLITRDNSKGARNCEYFVELEESPPQLSGEVRAYLESGEDIPDPSEEVLVWSFDEKKAYVDAFGRSQGTTRTQASSRPAVRPAGAQVEAGANDAEKTDPTPATPPATPATIGRPLGAAVRRPAGVAVAAEVEKPTEAPAAEPTPESPAQSAAAQVPDAQPGAVENTGSRRPRVSWRK